MTVIPEDNKTKHSCLVIVGEQSGEDHFLSFFPRLKPKADIDFFGVAGDRSKDLGMELIYHMNDFSTMGFTEAIKKISFYLKAEKKLLHEVDKRQTGFAILVDFQGFNLKIAKKLKDRGVMVFYYVAPQAWAWKPWRAKALSHNVDYLFCILPFEKEWFEKRGVACAIPVRHPLMDKYGPNLPKLVSSHVCGSNDSFCITLLPGSRESEVKVLLPIFIDVLDKLKKKHSSLKVLLVQSPSVDPTYFTRYEKYIDEVYDPQNLHESLLKSDLAIAASGTVTLTCGLFMIPTIVCYKVGLVNEFIFHHFVKYDGYISLVNLILQKEVFPELLQYEVTVDRILSRVEYYMDEPNSLLEIRNDLSSLVNKLQGEMSGHAVGEFIGDKMILNLSKEVGS